MDNEDRPAVGKTIEIQDGTDVTGAVRWIPAIVNEIGWYPHHARIVVQFRSRENRGGEIYWGWKSRTLRSPPDAWRWPPAAALLAPQDPVSIRWITEAQETVARYGFDPLANPFKGLLADLLQAKFIEHYMLAEALVRLAPHLTHDECRRLNIDELRKFVGIVR